MTKYICTIILPCILLSFKTTSWSTPVDTLPVVVHVIHTGTPIGSPDNPSDSLIQAMILLMNNAFQKNGSMYGGADIGLAFGLARRSPACENTSGINRVDGSSIASYESGGITTDTNFFPNSAHEQYVKALSRWSNTDYINIWLVNMIDGDPGGLAGYAYYPQYNSALTDGIVLRADVANGTNKTIIHELGHYFDLRHVFEGSWDTCATESDCELQGDLICDTEIMMFEFQCTDTINSCSGNPWLIADTVLNYTVLNNYMGYTSCQWMFTEDQKTRMHEALSNYRRGLITSGARMEPPGIEPVDGCIPTAVNDVSPYYGIQLVEFGDLHVYSNSSQADGAFYIDRSCNQRVHLYPGETLLLRITGSFTNYAQIKVFLDYDNDGELESPGELVLSGNGGVVEDSITIPETPMILCEPLRMRVITDHPLAPEVTPCLLTGTPEDGVGQIEDYAVIISHRRIESIASGDWHNPLIWNCNCVPDAMDDIYIHAGHTIQVTADAYCAKLTLEDNAEINMMDNVYISGGCP